MCAIWIIICDVSNLGQPRGFYRSWDSANLKYAMQAVEEGRSVRRAAEMYNIPKSTLHDHVRGRIAFGARSGPDPYLTVEEEEELTNFLVQVASIGYPRTKKQVLSLVENILASRKIFKTVSNGWWERFVHRNPRLTLRSGIPLSLARASATDPEMLCRYYDTLEHTLRENDLYDKPGLLFNCDETGMALNPASPRVVQEIGVKNPNFITSGNKTQLTVLACTGASGYAIPPYIIFDRLTWNPNLAEGEVPGSLYGLSKTGWIDSELFHLWFADHFLNYVPHCRPLLLLLDGHSSHYCPSFIKLAAEKGVVVYVLPPNTTHITQPLDKGCFSPLKNAWSQVCHDFRCKNPGRVVSRYDFSRLFSKAWYEAMTPKNIISSFKCTGVYPFSRMPGPEEEEYREFQPDRLAKKTGLKYIPMHCPSPFRKHMTPKSSAVTPWASAAEEDSLDYAPKPIHPVSCVDSISPPTLSQRFSRASSVPLRTTTNLSTFFNVPIPPHMLPTTKQKSCGRCLTSEEGLRIVKEKEEKMEAKMKQKEERKLKQEEKIRAKEDKLACKSNEVVRKKGKKKQQREGSEIQYYCGVMNCM